MMPATERQTVVRLAAGRKLNPDAPGIRYRKPALTNWLLGTAFLLGPAVAWTQEKPAAAPIETCIDCHGANGIALDPATPHLNGQPAALLTNMMDSFRRGARPPKVRIHREIPAADVGPLASHYAQQKAQRPKSATRPELVVRGETLYLNRCGDCHIENGRDTDKEAPLLAAQELNYLIAQMKAFKAGERKFPFLMDGAYRDLGDEDLTAIAHFFAAQDQVAPQTGRRRRR
jgi:cytochrome c553